jgi:adenine-specific DNA glycosylase
MIKPKTTKRDTRKELESLVDQFIKKNGTIQQVNMGESGLVDGKYNTSHIGFNEPKQDRTPLNHVVAAIQQRKYSKSPPSQPIKKKPKKKVIYDDFGEPLRWVWEE